MGHQVKEPPSPIFQSSQGKLWSSNLFLEHVPCSSTCSPSRGPPLPTAFHCGCPILLRKRLPQASRLELHALIL